MSKLSEKEKKQRMEHKSQEIRDEFFKTYVGQLKGLTPEEQRKARRKVPWHENMTVTSDKRVKLEQSAFNHDVQREIQIYNIALENTQRAIGYLTQEGVRSSNDKKIPVQRPKDYEVEMFKAPKQVTRIENRIEIVNKRKLARQEKQDRIRQSKQSGTKRKGLFKKGQKQQKTKRPGKVARTRDKQKKASMKQKK